MQLCDWMVLRQRRSQQACRGRGSACSQSVHGNVKVLMSGLLQQIRLLDGFQDILLGRLLSLASQQELVQDKIRLLEVKDDIQLTNTAEVFVEQLDVAVDDLQCDQFVVLVLNGTAEIQTGVSFIHDFQVPPLQEAAHLWLTGQNGLHQLPRDLLLLLIRQRNVPFLQTELALSAEQQHELHLSEEVSL